MKLEEIFDPYRKEWGLIFKVLAFNAIVSLSLIGALSVLDKFENIEQFNAVTAGVTRAYFNSLSFANFWIFFKQNCVVAPISEEMIWRLPVFVFMAWNFNGFFRNQKLAKCTLWLSLIVPTWFWASGHLLPLPVFVTGITYGWLIIKTKPLWPWPAITCHSFSNLSLYVLVKILQGFGYAPIN